MKTSKIIALFALLSGVTLSAQNLKDLKNTAVGQAVETQVNQTKDGLVKQGEEKLEDYKKQGEDAAGSTALGSTAKTLVNNTQYKKDLDSKIEDQKEKIVGGKKEETSIETPTEESVSEDIVKEKLELSETVVKGNETVTNANTKIAAAKERLEQDKKEGKVTEEEYQVQNTKIENLAQKVLSLQGNLNKGEGLAK